jgi:hypothetical protein
LVWRAVAAVPVVPVEGFGVAGSVRRAVAAVPVVSVGPGSGVGCAGAAEAVAEGGSVTVVGGPGVAADGGGVAAVAAGEIAATVLVAVPADAWSAPASSSRVVNVRLPSLVS